MQRIVITGSNRGIGLGIVEAYLKRGDMVFATCRNPEAATALQALETASYSDRLHVVELDAGDDDSIAAAAQTIAAQTDSIDLLVNNAGINPRAKGEQSFEKITSELMMHLYRVNTVGALMTVKAFVDLLANGKNPRIVNVSSQMGSFARPSRGNFYAYTTSKAAMNMLTHRLSADLHPQGICVISAHPGRVKTDLTLGRGEITVAESAEGMVRLMDGLTLEDTDGFFKWNGEGHAW